MINQPLEAFEALYDYDANDSDELTFKQGETCNFSKTASLKNQLFFLTRNFTSKQFRRHYLGPLQLGGGLVAGFRGGHVLPQAEVVPEELRQGDRAAPSAASRRATHAAEAVSPSIQGDRRRRGAARSLSGCQTLQRSRPTEATEAAAAAAHYYDAHRLGKRRGEKHYLFCSSAPLPSTKQCFCSFHLISLRLIWITYMCV